MLGRDLSPQAEGSTATPAPTRSPDTDDSGSGQTTSSTSPGPGRTYTEREQELLALLRRMRVANPGVAEHGFADIAHVGGTWRGRYAVVHTAGSGPWYQLDGRDGGVTPSPR